MGRTRASNRNWIAGAVIVILAALIFFAPSYGWAIRAWLSPSATSQTDNQTLAAENDALQAQLATLQTVASQLPTSMPDAIRAMVYSRYPMDFRNELLVNTGANAGVTPGDAVTFQGMLIGQVRTVFPEESVVQTIFDDTLKMPVRIGTTGTDGLLQGGSDPSVGSIANTAAITAGDIVYSAAPGIPYGLPVATVTATSTSPDSLFEQATLDLPYDVNDIETVLIMK